MQQKVCEECDTYRKRRILISWTVTFSKRWALMGWFKTVGMCEMISESKVRLVYFGIWRGMGIIEMTGAQGGCVWVYRDIYSYEYVSKKVVSRFQIVYRSNWGIGYIVALFIYDSKSHCCGISSSSITIFLFFHSFASSSLTVFATKTYTSSPIFASRTCHTEKHLDSPSFSYTHATSYHKRNQNALWTRKCIPHIPTVLNQPIKFHLFEKVTVWPIRMCLFLLGSHSSHTFCHVCWDMQLPI